MTSIATDAQAFSNISATTSAQVASVRLDTTTDAPASANPTASARPMPLLAPVMIATLSRRVNRSMG